MPKILAKKTIAKTRVFTVEEVDLVFDNGVKASYEIAEGKAAHAVMVIPKLDANTILLTREYAVGIDDYVLGFAKGAVDPGEEILAAANRELKEEVGYGANKLTLLKSMHSTPAYRTGTMHYVLAEDLYEEKLEGDEPEPIEVIPWQLDNLAELIARPDFCESRSVAGLMLIEGKLELVRRK